MNIVPKIYNRFTKACLQPIRVFCLHHVSKEYNPLQMCEGDWMEIGAFQQKVQQMQQSGIEFISLSYAHKLLRTSAASLSTLFRRKRYAVLTFDDGYKSLDEILPWLIENKIPVTLFINGKYTDGKSQRKKDGMHFSYLTADELKHYVEISNGLISLQCHGYEHLDATAMSSDAFREQIEKNVSTLSTLHFALVQPRFHAYTWGRHNATTDAILQENNIIPVLVDGMKNYNDASCIHRELLEHYDQ